MALFISKQESKKYRKNKLIFLFYLFLVNYQFLKSEVTVYFDTVKV